uniref:Uncharacterized protein n=1 Tax=Sanya narnavirus 2 TaxID=2905314 RepID=A0A8K1XHI1_9VIRU|nr:MAG: hypothetical protein SaNV2_gp2 [Sanya narnavirus 2]
MRSASRGGRWDGEREVNPTGSLPNLPIYHRDPFGNSVPFQEPRPSNSPANKEALLEPVRQRARSLKLAMQVLGDLRQPGVSAQGIAVRSFPRSLSLHSSGYEHRYPGFRLSGSMGDGLVFTDGDHKAQSARLFEAMGFGAKLRSRAIAFLLGGHWGPEVPIQSEGAPVPGAVRVGRHHRSNAKTTITPGAPNRRSKPSWIGKSAPSGLPGIEQGNVPATEHLNDVSIDAEDGLSKGSPSFFVTTFLQDRTGCGWQGDVGGYTIIRWFGEEVADRNIFYDEEGVNHPPPLGPPERSSPVKGHERSGSPREEGCTPGYLRINPQVSPRGRAEGPIRANGTDQKGPLGEDEPDPRAVALGKVGLASGRPDELLIAPRLLRSMCRHHVITTDRTRCGSVESAHLYSKVVKGTIGKGQVCCGQVVEIEHCPRQRKAHHTTSLRGYRWNNTVLTPKIRVAHSYWPQQPQPRSPDQVVFRNIKAITETLPKGLDEGRGHEVGGGCQIRGVILRGHRAYQGTRYLVLEMGNGRLRLTSSAQVDAVLSFNEGPYRFADGIPYNHPVCRRSSDHAGFESQLLHTGGTGLDLLVRGDLVLHLTKGCIGHDFQIVLFAVYPYVPTFLNEEGLVILAQRSSDGSEARFRQSEKVRTLAALRPTHGLCRGRGKGDGNAILKIAPPCPRPPPRPEVIRVEQRAANVRTRIRQDGHVLHLSLAAFGFSGEWHSTPETRKLSECPGVLGWVIEQGLHGSCFELRDREPPWGGSPFPVRTSQLFGVKGACAAVLSVRLHPPHSLFETKPPQRSLQPAPKPQETNRSLELPWVLQGPTVPLQFREECKERKPNSIPDPRCLFEVTVRDHTPAIQPVGLRSFTRSVEFPPTSSSGWNPKGVSVNPGAGYIGW